MPEEIYNESVWEKPDDYKPGSLGCHEALHMSNFLSTTVSRELVEHPAIQQNPVWLAAANNALKSLSSLYQLIADKHLSA